MVKTAAISKPPLLRLVLLQMLATTLLTIAIGWHQNWAWSVLAAVMMGGGIATMANGYSAWRSFLHPAGDNNCGESTDWVPERVVAAMYQAAFMKLLLVGVTLALAFKYGDALNKPVLLGSFIAISLFGLACSSSLMGSMATAQAAQASATKVEKT